MPTVHEALQELIDASSQPPDPRVRHAWEAFCKATLRKYRVEKYRTLAEAENRGIRQLAITAMAHQEQEEAQRESVEVYQRKVAEWKAKSDEANREFARCEQILGPDTIREARSRAEQVHALQARLEECRHFRILQQECAGAYTWYLGLQPRELELERDLARCNELALASVSKPVLREEYRARLSAYEARRPVEPEPNEHPGPFPLSDERFAPEPSFFGNIRVDAPVLSLPRHCRVWFDDAKREIEGQIASAGDAFTMDQVRAWVTDLRELGESYREQGLPRAALAVSSLADMLLEQGKTRHAWLSSTKPKVDAYQETVARWQSAMTDWNAYEQARRRYKREFSAWFVQEADISPPTFASETEEQAWRSARTRLVELRVELRTARDLADQIKREMRDLGRNLTFDFELWLANNGT
jgi:hypothetical protein